MIDKLTKEKSYISYTIDKNITIAKVALLLLLNNIYKLHGHLLSLSLDRCPRYILRV